MSIDLHFIPSSNMNRSPFRNTEYACTLPLLNACIVDLIATMTYSRTISRNNSSIDCSTSPFKLISWPRPPIYPASIQSSTTPRYSNQQFVIRPSFMTQVKIMKSTKLSRNVLPDQLIWPILRQPQALAHSLNLIKQS